MAFGSNDLVGCAWWDWIASRNWLWLHVRLQSRFDPWQSRTSRFCFDREAIIVVHPGFRTHCVRVLGMFVDIFLELLLEPPLATRYFPAHFRSGGFGGNDESTCSSIRGVQLVLSEAVLSETVLVLDGYSNCGTADRGSRRFAGTCGPIGPIAILGRSEYEYRDAEYEYEKKHEL